MSEFSQSFFLRSTDIGEAIALLQSAKVPGYVRPARNGWVPFVFPRGSQLGLDDCLARVVGANRGLLVEYAYAEDHGSSCAVYRGSHRVAQVDASFEGKRARFDRARFVALGLMSERAADDVQRWIDHGQVPGVLVIAQSLGSPRPNGGRMRTSRERNRLRVAFMYWPTEGSRNPQLSTMMLVRPTIAKVRRMPSHDA